MSTLSLRGDKDLQLRLVLLFHDVKKQRINGYVTVHVHHELMIPPQDLGGAGDVDGGVEHHLPLGDVGDEAGGVVGELEAVEAGGEAEELAGLGGLGAGQDVSGAEEGAFVEDGHGGGGVVDGSDVGVGDVDGEDEVGVEEGEVELE